MLDPAAHEQAALLIGTLALREAAGGFTDPRQQLCRMSAHMALARALRQGARSPVADYADALLLTLVKRQREALHLLDRIDGAGPASRWLPLLRALRIRNTRDWRILSSPTKATLIERLEHYRALNHSLGSAHAMAFLEAFEVEPVGDWARIALEVGGSVEQWQVFAGHAVATETVEAAEVWELLYGKPAAGDAWATALNARPQRLIVEDNDRVTPRVLGWGMWARFFQRNVCFSAQASVYSLAVTMGVDDEAAVRRRELESRLLRLEFWPAVTLKWTMDGRLLRTAPGRDTAAAIAEACRRGLSLVQSDPEDLPLQLWQDLNNGCSPIRDRSLPARWLVRLAPAGTALTQFERSAALVSLAGPPAGSLDELQALAPFDPLILGMLPQLAEDASEADLRARYGSLVEYDLGAMEALAIAHKGDLKAFRTLYDKVVAIEPARSLHLASWLADMDLDDAAAAAYQLAVEKARDRVAVSHHVLWLVGYYCDRSQIERARAVADLAADVYSSTGIRTKAYFLERIGRYAEAEEWYRKIVERYGETSRAPLDEFYIRYEHRVADGRFAREAKAALARVFPAGLERVTVGELKAAPVDGVRISGRSQASTRFGLVKDDVVVALEGYRVRTHAQYDVLRTLDDTPRRSIIVWRHGRYLEIHGEIRFRRYDPISRPI
jgi:hypothetical protein